MNTEKETSNFNIGSGNQNNGSGQMNVGSNVHTGSNIKTSINLQRKAFGIGLFVGVLLEIGIELLLKHYGIL